MRLRKLRLPSGTWRFKFEKNTPYILLWSPGGKKTAVPRERVFTSAMCDCGPEYSCFGWGFSPRALRRFIETNLTQGTTP